MLIAKPHTTVPSGLISDLTIPRLSGSPSGRRRWETITPAAIGQNNDSAPDLATNEARPSQLGAGAHGEPAGLASIRDLNEERLNFSDDGRTIESPAFHIGQYDAMEAVARYIVGLTAAFIDFVGYTEDLGQT